MSLHKLSFATINMLEANIAEVIVDNKIIISLEMVEELEAFLLKLLLSRLRYWLIKSMLINIRLKR
jgi:hypothetical protein